MAFPQLTLDFLSAELHPYSSSCGMIVTHFITHPSIPPVSREEGEDGPQLAWTRSSDTSQLEHFGQ